MPGDRRGAQRRRKTRRITRPADHPQELAECAAACRDAGACMLHLHVRNAEGGHSLAPADYRPAIDAVRRAVGRSLVLQLTSEAVGIYAPAEQQAMVRELRPEAVSWRCARSCRTRLPSRRALSFSPGPIASEIVAQYILYGADDVERYSELRRRDVIPEGRHWVLFVLGRYTAGQRSSLADLLPMLAAWRAAGEITAGVPWSTCAFGPREIECSLGAAALGGHVRIGFENNLQLPDGRVARDNAELVSCFVEVRRAAWPFICQRRPPTQPIPLIGRLTSFPRKRESGATMLGDLPLALDPRFRGDDERDRGAQIKPPFTWMSWPVTYEASREARNATTAATSSGSPMRPSGTFRAKSRHSCALRNCSVPACLRIRPGTTALTVIPAAAKGTDTARPSPPGPPWRRRRRDSSGNRCERRARCGC